MRLLPSFFLALLLSFSSNLYAKQYFGSGEKSNTVLELFTSEGCSSCPPADEWFSEFKGTPELFTQIVPLAFHVDYWDGLGWSDKYAKKEYSNRQRQYQKSGNARVVATPAVMKNGFALRHRYNANKDRATVGVLNATLEGKTLKVNFDNLAKQKNLILNAALLGVDIVSSVQSGENRGRRLKHDFVVLEHDVHKTNQSTQQLGWSIPLPDSNIKAPNYGVALWVSNSRTGEIIQGTGAMLN